jgi:hypothetical protein
MHEFDNTAFSREAESEYPSPGGVFSEAQEVQLAEQLLELENEQQLEQFLGDLISKAGSAIGSLIKLPVGQALGGALKSVAGEVLPMVGQAIGGMFGPAGAPIGGQLASAAGSAFGLNEMEAGEQEYEAAQTFVRMAADAVKNAASAPPGMNPHAVAQAAVAQAAQTHAPALLGLSPIGRASRVAASSAKVVLLVRAVLRPSAAFAVKLVPWVPALTAVLSAADVPATGNGAETQSSFTELRDQRCLFRPMPLGCWSRKRARCRHAWRG